MPNNSYKILLVEDEQPMINIIVSKLKQNNFDVVTADTVKEALDLVDENKKIDLVWLDHYLKDGQTGLDFLTEYKRRFGKVESPVFVASNTGSHEKKHDYFEKGVKNYYVKSNSRLDGIIEDIQQHFSL